MANPLLPQSTEKLIARNIDEIYERLKQRLFGFFYEPKINLGVKSDKTLSLPGLYASAYADSGATNKPSIDAMRALTSVAESYINSAAEKTKAKAISSVIDALSSAQNQEDFNYENELNSALLNVFDQAHGDTKKVVETELQRTKTVGLQQGILDVLKDQGFDDPTVAFLTRQDAMVCKYCKMFFVNDDGTPKVYKLSELGSGFLDRKSPKPILPPVHPNCFLYGTGRVYTNKGFKRIKNVSFNDKVMTHEMRWCKVVNTLNFLKTPYQENYYEIRPTPGGTESVCVTPDHEVFTNNGFKPISEINYLDDKLVRVVKKCIVCSKRILFNYPKYFCSDICRDKALGCGSKYIHQFPNDELELEEFSPAGAVFHHNKTEPTFLYDITVQTDHSLMYNGLVTKNCRCIYDGDAEIILIQGTKKLKDVEIGDYVLTHNGRFKKVLATFGKTGIKPKEDDEIYAVWFFDKYGEKKMLRTTGDHLLMTPKGWIRVDQLTKKDKLFIVDYGHKIRDEQTNYLFKETDIWLINKVELKEKWYNGKEIRLYDIQVEDDASFVVNGVVSHNCLMVAVYPGFGFNSKGELAYKSEGYDEYAQQKSLKKSVLDIKTMLEHDCNEHRDNDLLAYLK